MFQYRGLNNWNRGFGAHYTLCYNQIKEPPKIVQVIIKTPILGWLLGDEEVLVQCHISEDAKSSGEPALGVKASSSWLG